MNNITYVNNYDKWIGPINYDKDKPVIKIMYDINNYLIGIGKNDGYIYKKEDYNWRDWFSRGFTYQDM